MHDASGTFARVALKMYQQLSAPWKPSQAEKEKKRLTAWTSIDPEFVEIKNDHEEGRRGERRGRRR